MLPTSPTDLEVVLGGDLLQLGLVGGQLGQFDVHRRTHGGPQVGGAEGQESKAVVVGERQPLLDVVDGVHQPLVHLLQVAAHLHGDQAEVVLLIAPHQEGLVLVVVDAAAGGPEAARVGGLQEAVALLEEEVVIDQLLLGLLGHAREGVEGALELALKARQGGGDFLLHLLVLGLGQAGVEGVALQRAAAAHAGGHDELAGGIEVAQGLHITPVLGRVHVGLLEASVVVLDDGVEQVSED